MKLKIVRLAFLAGFSAFSVSQWAVAEGTDAGSAAGAAQKADGEKDKSKSDAQDVPELLSGSSALGGGIFGTVSASEAAVTPSYQAPGFGLTGGRGAPVKLGNSILLYPKVTLSHGWNDNVLGTNSATPAIKSSYTSINAGMDIAFLGKVGHGGYGLSYRGNLLSYSSASADNGSNNTVEVYGDHGAGREHLSWGVGYQKMTDPRGSTTGVNVHADPDRWHAPTVRAAFTYGAPGAVGKLVLEGSGFEKTYENNLVDMAKLDVRSTNLAGRFYYRLMPKTSAVFELRQVNNNYQTVGAQPDSTARYYQVGVTWEATAKTTGIVKVGRVQQSFSDATPSGSGGSWEADVEWRPLSYSVVRLGTTRTVSDSTGVGTYQTNTNNSLTWAHQWSSKWATHASAADLKTSFAGTARDDDTKNYGVGVTYQMRRWLHLGLDSTMTQRTSTDPTNPTVDNSFKRNVTMFTVEGTL
jgi:hypothetical protein